MFVYFVNRLDGRVLGIHNDGPEHDNNGNHFGNNQNDTDDEFESITPIVTPDPTVSPTEIIASPTVTDQSEDVQEEAGVEDVVFDDNLESNNENNVSSNNQDNSEKHEEVIVSVVHRSIVTESNLKKPITVSKKSIVKAIENKIKSVGRGEFLSKPKTVPTPSSLDKTENNTGSGVKLGPDSSIFYQLLGDENVLLGAVDENNKRINVDEFELRSAELTMDKVLKKKGLNLGVSSENSLVFVEGGAKAYFDLPVFVDVFDSDVYLNTASGKKKMLITPRQSVSIAKNDGKLELDSSSYNINLLTRKGNLYYEVSGKKTYLAFGRYPITIDKTIYVDAESGEFINGDDGVVALLVKSMSK